MTINNELFKRLQKEASALTPVVHEDAAAIKRLNEMEMKRNAFDAAAVLHLFLPGLTMIER